MGRYYFGDIDGKFMCAVQSSNAADRFGSLGQSPDSIEYHFSEEHLPTINEELEKLKDAHEKVTKFFESIGNGGYNDEMAEEYGVTQQDLSDYADYNLGIEYINSVAEKAIDMNIGARGIRSIVDNSLINLMYRAPSLREEGVVKILMNKYPNNDYSPDLEYENGNIISDTEYKLYRGINE